jgi:hypothetical protein
MTTRSRLIGAATLAWLAASTYSVRADVRADEKSKVEFAGALGRMVNLFGGRAARDGVTTSRMVKGDRMASVTDNTEQIVDLAEEKIYQLDLKKKTYTAITFEELRQRMQDAMKHAEQQASQSPEAGATKPAEQPQMDVDVDVKATGATKQVSGFDTRETIMTITLREKGKTLEDGGGMVVTSDMWLAPAIPSMREILEFQMRFAQKLAGPVMTGASAEQMSAAVAMYPFMKQAMNRLNEEGAKLDGTAIQTVTTVEAVKSAADMAASQSSKGDEPATGGSLGGLVGGLARRAAHRSQEPPSSRSTVMKTTTEVLNVATSVSDAEVAVPTGFKLAK